MNQAQQGGKVDARQRASGPEYAQPVPECTMPQVKEQMKAAERPGAAVHRRFSPAQGCLRRGCMCCRITKCRMSWS